MATMTVEDFLAKARPLNPDYSDDELIQAYHEQYTPPPTQTVSPAPLMTLDEFMPKARALNPDYSDEELQDAWQEKYGNRGARETDQGDFLRGGSTAFKQLPQLASGLEAGAGAVGEKVFGEGSLFTALKNHGLKGYQEAEAEIAKESKPSDSVTEAYNMARAGNPGALVDWLQYALGYGGGQVLQMLATAGIGTAVGKLTLQPAAKLMAEKMIAKESARLAATGLAGEQLAKQAVSNVAGKIGQISALGATAVGMEGGEIYGGLVEKAAEEGRSLTGKELAKAAGATLGAGALELVGDKIGLDLVLGKSVAGKLVSSRLGHAAAAGSLGLTTEGGTEFTQTLIEEFGKGNDPFSPESITQAIDAAALGGVSGGAVGTVGGVLRQPQGHVTAPTVTERTPEELGIPAPQVGEIVEEPRQLTGPPQPGEVRGGTVYGAGEVLDVSPLPDVSPITQASSLDDAIAASVGVVRGATETAKARAAELARMTAKARNDADRIMATAPTKRAGTEIPILPGPTPAEPSLLNQPSPIVPGQAFTPRVEPEADPRARLEAERARMVAERERRRVEQPAQQPALTAPVQADQSTDETPLPSQADLAYPTSKQMRDLIHEKGFHLDTPVFRQVLKGMVGKEKFSDLTPQELQRLKDKLDALKPSTPPVGGDISIQTETITPPPQVPLTPTKEKPSAPVTTIPEAQVPRSELTPEKNAEILLRAEKAKADMEIAGMERVGRFFQEQDQQGGTRDVIGLKSPTAGWYKELTSGPSPAIRGDRKQSAREKIEQAIQKIIQDKGADRGKAVEQVKAALLQDREFSQTEWGRDLNSILDGEWPTWIEKPEGKESNNQPVSNVARGTTQVSPEEQTVTPQPIKVPQSRTERLAQEKQKMGEKRSFSVDRVDSQTGEPRTDTFAVGDYVTAWLSKDHSTHGTITGISHAKQEAKVGNLWYEFGRIYHASQPEPKVKTQPTEPLSKAVAKAEQAPPSGWSDSDKVGAKPKNALSLVDQMYRSILDDTKVVHRMQREQKDQWATVKRIDATIKDGLKAGLEYDEAAAKVPAKDLAELANILGTPETTPAQAETAQPQREPTLAQDETAPTEAPFSLTSPEVRQAKAKPEDRQTSLDIPAPTIGERPIIGRETTPEESPLFSKAAQTQDAEQTELSQASAVEDLPDSTERHAKLLRDLLVSEPFKSQGFGGLDIPTQRKVLGSVFAAAQDLKVREAIIRRIPVDVMNYLGREKFSANAIFDNETVFKQLFSPSSDSSENVSVSINMADSLVLIAAHEAAKLINSSSVEGPSESSSAMSAGNGSRSSALAQPHASPAAKRSRFTGVNTPSKEIMTLEAGESIGSHEVNILPHEGTSGNHDKTDGNALATGITTLEAYDTFKTRLRDGEVTLDEYQQAFEQVAANKDVLLAELKKLTKADLIKRSNSMRSRSSDSKDSLVRDAYDSIFGGFALGRGVSYMMSSGSYADAVKKMVEKTTADDLTKFAEEVAKNRADYQARVQGFLEPKTLEDFDTRVRLRGESSLNPEQLARYDELLAQAGREKRKQAQEQKATVQGVDAGTDLQMIESKHTKTGEKLWVVKLANRVDRAVYDRLNQAAHKLGGRYSSYNKDGAIPGFTFRSKEAADSFMAAGKGETVSAAPVRQAQQAERQDNAVSRLREMADRLREKADGSLNRDRQTNTARRARMASSAENAAYSDKQLGETMQNLADAIESGEATHLSGLRTKAQVEMLDSMITQAKHERIRQETKGSYAEYERQNDRKAEPEDAAMATFPTFNFYKDDLHSALNKLKEKPATERLRMRLTKVMAGAQENGKRQVSREDAELAIEKIGVEKYPGAPFWQWRDAMDRLKRLESMGITSLPELRAALREFVEYRGKRGTIDKAKQLERNLIGNKSVGVYFFPTPKETAQRMVAEADIRPGMTVLEPSAGNGNIAEAIRAAGVDPDVVEISSSLREILEAKGFKVVGQDFMDLTDGEYDRIIMNPPFSNGQDAEHIQHAYSLLKPGGKLVAIAGEGVFFRNDAKAKAFRDFLAMTGGTDEPLPAGTFQDASLMASTGANARMVVLEKPGGEAVQTDAEAQSTAEDAVESSGGPFSFFGDERGSVPVTGRIDLTKTREQLTAAEKTMRPFLLGSLGLEQIAQVYGREQPEVARYNRATQAMEADFVEMSRSSEQIVKAWTKLKIPVADKMAQVMEDARFLNFDPDPKKNQEADSVKKQELVRRFEQLPSEAQATYRLARDFYTNMAEERFQALKERIERAGGTPENTRKLVDRLQVAYEQVRSKVYFPFSRFGENIVVAKKMENGVEKDREVHAFESPAEAQKFATMMKLKGWQVKQTVARQYSVDNEGPASKIVKQMHDIIRELGEGHQEGLPGVMDLQDQLLDSLNQSFLQALPDMSYAKNFIHAKDVKGASKDALRAFAHSALHGAHHISRIRHADKVTKALMDMDTRINETAEGDTTEARQVYNELVQRHNEILNPSTHPVAAWLGQLGFTMSLGGVVATGITNATQVPLITYPWLGARYGFGKASAALAKAYKQFLDPRTINKESLFDVSKSKMISTSEREMLAELARRGRIDMTQTMDLAGLASQDNLSRRARSIGTTQEKVMRMLGFTFHAPEVMNRQVTALAAFRLEKERGGSYDEAVQRADQAIVDTHFIYSAENRPRYMSGNVLRVLTMFKQYSQNVAYLYGRAASVWMDKNNMSPEERQVAKRQLLSMLALQFGAAGTLGLPFVGGAADMLMAVVGAFGDDDDKRDWEVAFRKWLSGQAVSLAEALISDKETAQTVGRKAEEVISHGASRLTPFDMAQRLGQQDLFIREPNREREGRAAAMDWLTSLGGPVVGYAVNSYLGVGDVAKGMRDADAGFFMRGVEELTPAVIRNSVKALRYMAEEVRTRDQHKQLDLRPDEKLGQFFGFTPSRVAEMYESTTAVKNREHRIVRERKHLFERFSRAVSDRDESKKRKVLDDIRAFNQRNGRMFAITSDSLNRSMKGRIQREQGMERGLYLPPKRRELLDEGEFGNF